MQRASRALTTEHLKVGRVIYPINTGNQNAIATSTVAKLPTLDALNTFVNARIVIAALAYDER